MTAHVYNAIIIANDLNIMVSLNYSTRCLGRCGQNDCPSIHFQFTVFAIALLVSLFFSSGFFIATAWQTGKRSNRIRYTAQITMKIYELFSQCEFISWRARCVQMPAKRLCRWYLFSLFSLCPSLSAHPIAPKTNRIVNNFMESKWQLRLFCLDKIQRSSQYS